MASILTEIVRQEDLDLTQTNIQRMMHTLSKVRRASQKILTQVGRAKCSELIWHSNRPITLANHWLNELHDYLKKLRKRPAELKEKEQDLIRMEGEGGPAGPPPPSTQVKVVH